MAKYCIQCGAKLADEAKFCPNCGTASVQPQAQQVQQPQVQQVRQPQAAQPDAAPFDYGAPTPPPAAQVGEYAYGGAAEPAFDYQPFAGGQGGGPAAGYSRRVNDPEILAAVQKSRRAAKGFTFLLVPLPVVGFTVYSFFSDMETADAFRYGLILGAIFLVFALVSFVKERAANTYEATVIDKKTRRAYRKNDSDTFDTEYITVARTTAGKKVRYVEREGGALPAWNYLEVGDRFMYHPQFHFPYELYDKSRARYIPCVNCPCHNPLTADRCQKCGLPLLK